MWPLGRLGRGKKAAVSQPNYDKGKGGGVRRGGGGLGGKEEAWEEDGQRLTRPQLPR